MPGKNQKQDMQERKSKEKLNYLFAGLGLLLALLLISSFGMWLVQEFLDHFDSRKYREAAAVADGAWDQSVTAKPETLLPTNMTVGGETETGEETLNAVLLDGNRLNDAKRLQVLAELSLKPYGKAYGNYLEREPLEEIEMTETEARERAFQFLELINVSIPASYVQYREEGVKMNFRADPAHPSVSLWVADLTTHGCVVLLYLDARTGLPVRFRTAYDPFAWADASGSVCENAAALDILASGRSAYTDNPVFVESLLSYLAENLTTNFYTNPIVGNVYPEGSDDGAVRFLPVSQWMTDDYRYVLTWAFQNNAVAGGCQSKFDLVLSPMEAQETVRNIFSDEYGYWIQMSNADG